MRILEPYNLKLYNLKTLQFNFSQLHRLLAAFFLPLHFNARLQFLQNSRLGFCDRLLAGLHEQRFKSSHLYDFQQRLSASISSYFVQVMFILCLLLSLRLTFNRKSDGEGDDGHTNTSLWRLFTTQFLSSHDLHNDVDGVISVLCVICEDVTHTSITIFTI